VTAIPPGLDAVILTEAGPDRGLGHLARCLALAEALKGCGACPRLFVRGVDRVPQALAVGVAAEPSEWLNELPRALAGCGIAVVDSYEAPAQMYVRVAQAARVGVWLDDNRRLEYPPGLVVDGGVQATGRRGDRVPPGMVLLFGPRFQPLRRPFWTCAPRAIRDHVRRILVVIGGTDVHGLGARVVAALSAAHPSVVLDLVEGGRSAAGMAEAMAEADLGVTAAGQTLFELAAAGVPAVGIIVADNQRSNAEGWAAAGFLRLAQRWDDDDLERSIVEAVGEWWPRNVREHSVSAGRALCDGRGALRVAQQAVGAWRASWLALRPAGVMDEASLLTLSNHPQVREGSFRSDPIAPDEHHSWFMERLRDPDSLLFVVEDDSGVAGLVRFRINGAVATVGIALAPRTRGRRMAMPILERALAVLVAARSGVREAVALVRAENGTSRAMFASAGFTEEGPVEMAAIPSVRFVRAL